MPLPSNYTELEYIESTGTQYIDTGFKHNQNTRVVMDVQATNITENSWAFEGRIATNSARHGVFFYYTSSNLWTMDYSGTRIPFSGILPTDRLLIDYNKNTCSINGETNTATAGTFQSTANLTLLSANTNGTIAGYLKARLYSCQIYDNDILIRNYVPCKNSSGTIGLYDLVNNIFYQNAGTGAFIAGPEVAPPPPEPEPVDLSALIYDRTQTDGDRIKSYINKGYQNLTSGELVEWNSAKSKGSWNYTDLNRIGSWINLLRKLLPLAGVDISSVPFAPMDYDKNSNLWAEDAEQLRSSILALRDLFANNPELENMVPGPSWNFAQANALEKNLQILYDSIGPWYIYPLCGEAVCGGDYL